MAEEHREEQGPTRALRALQALGDSTSAALDAARSRQKIALINIAKGVEGAEAEADTISVQVRDLKDRLTAIRSTIAESERANVELQRNAIEAERAKERETLVGLAKKARKALSAVDVAADALSVALSESRNAVRLLWEKSDGQARREGLGEIPRLMSELSAVLYERLAHGEVFPSRSGLLDRTKPAHSVEGHLNLALNVFAPPPGRPKKEGAEPPLPGPAEAEQ